MDAQITLEPQNMAVPTHYVLNINQPPVPPPDLIAAYPRWRYVAIWDSDGSVTLKWQGGRYTTDGAVEWEDWTPKKPKP